MGQTSSIGTHRRRSGWLVVLVATMLAGLLAPAAQASHGPPGNITEIRVWDGPVQQVTAREGFYLQHGWVVGDCEPNGEPTAEQQAELDGGVLSFELTIDGVVQPYEEVFGCMYLDEFDVWIVNKQYRYTYRAGLAEGTYDVVGRWVKIEPWGPVESVSEITLEVVAPRLGRTPPQAQ